jgi:hypothetical protein
MHLGCWISACYGLLSLSVHFETHKPFISLIFKFFVGGRSTPQVTEAADIESVNTGAHL